MFSLLFDVETKQIFGINCNCVIARAIKQYINTENNECTVESPYNWYNRCNYLYVLY